MSKLIKILVAQIASIASFVGLFVSTAPASGERPLWQWGLLLVTLVAQAFAFGVEVADYWRSAPKSYRSQAKINAYMRKLVSSAGRVVIFSRDLSWTGDESTKNLLLQKAGKNELTIFVERPIPFTRELSKRGARIIPYEALKHVPRSRFTIMDFDREGARVAIGTKQGDAHVIQCFRNGSDPMFALAEDMVKLLTGVCRQHL
jgi:hypothetical protein